MELKIIQPILLENFLAEVPVGLYHTFETLQEAELSLPNFSFYTSVASVFNSKIEGT